MIATILIQVSEVWALKELLHLKLKEVAILMRTDKKIAEMTKYYCTRRKISEALFPEKS
jgi:hypothetical protein